MGYKATKPTVYIVQWPGENLVKVGFSCNQRWRPFVLRGAAVVDLVEFDSAVDAFDFETLVLRGFAKIGSRAFTCADDATPYLGSGGGGWLECYRLPDGVKPADVLAETDWSVI